MFRPFRVSEIKVCRAGSHNQRVIGNPRAILQLHLAGRGINLSHLTQQHAGIFLPVQNVAQRGGDLTGRKCSGSHLIEQRLEEMKIPPVDQRQVHVRPLQRLCRIKAPETSADNHHTVAHIFRLTDRLRQGFQGLQQWPRTVRVRGFHVRVKAGDVGAQVRSDAREVLRRKLPQQFIIRSVRK